MSPNFTPFRRTRRLIRKCLEKDPRKSLRDIGDVWELLSRNPQFKRSTEIGDRQLFPGQLQRCFSWSRARSHLYSSVRILPEPRAIEFIMDAPPESVLDQRLRRLCAVSGRTVSRLHSRRCRQQYSVTLVTFSGFVTSPAFARH